MSENLSQSTSAGDTAATMTVAAAVPGPPGFELLDEVGRGGMGVVYRARDLALDREVAVKLLLHAYAPDSSVAWRFVDEARITGQLQHPGIPAVYQVGALADGRPFLAMKLIGGQTLDALLKSGAAVDALSVFAAISQAVGYAHAHGVIHRDLKPANVMVGAFGEVQVMDWGLAKVLTASRERQRPEGDPEATTAASMVRTERDSDTPFTQYGSMLGTPAYMAPEQAAGELDKIDARADVFGLGAMLCVLLTGKPPYEGKDAESVRIAAVRGQTAEALARLDGCAADPEVIALCKRCLAFDPGARPPTADAVAAEVAALRRAADERVRQAERDKLSAEVRATEQAKRRRAVQWAAGAVAAVLFLGVIGTGIGLYLANEGRKAALAAEQDADEKRIAAEAAREAEKQQKTLAQAKEAEAKAVVKFFEERVFSAARPKGQEGGQGKAVSLHDAIVASLPALDKAFANQPLVEARLRMTLGTTFSHLGEARAAEAQYARAQTLCTQHLGPSHPDTLQSKIGLALSYQALGRHTEALKLNEETLAAQKRLLPADHADTLASMSNLASSYYALGRHAEALKLYEETLAAQKRVLPADHPSALNSMINLAVTYQALDRHAEALKLQKETLATQKRVLPADHPDTLLSMNNLANSYQALGRHADALKLFEETLAAQKRVLPADHQDTLGSQSNVAISYRNLGREAEALPLLEDAFRRKLAVLPANHEYTLIAAYHLASCYLALDRGTDATAMVDRYLRHIAGKDGVSSSGIAAMLALRNRHPAKTGDASGCRATAAMWEKLDPRDAESLYTAACFRAVASAVQAKANGVDGERLAKEDADKAMEWLTKAVAAGYKDRAHLEKDADLDALRERADFKKLFESLPPADPAVPRK